MKALLPIALLLALALAGVAGWLAYCVTHPHRSSYLVTPENFSQLSNRGLKATDETWSNLDGTNARGWLLRGSEGAPAVILLHHYGADRSWLLNLGVKLNETTNFTVLWPDLRGHGMNPPVGRSSLGTLEADDVVAAIAYLRSLKTQQGRPLVGGEIGLFGTELGAYAAMAAAARESGMRVLVLDSVPASGDDMLRVGVKKCTGMDSNLALWLTRIGTRIYFLGRTQNMQTCQVAAQLAGRRVLLLSGESAGRLRASTVALAQCFPGQSGVEMKTDLPLTGLDLPTATGEQGEAYDRPVIDFFDRALNSNPLSPIQNP
ncbi:MAG TPA: hypothetical protein VK619_08410 [Pyrinomonadaceae bacterium]|nr:hypothetical protein [Pyrinomonadaceae bacterium]